jgi:phosphocarrier protein
MKVTHVVVPWTQGLHLRTAAQLTLVAKRFQSQIQLRVESMVVDARSTLSLLTLGAVEGTRLDILVAGEDEMSALDALQNFFRCSQNETPERSEMNEEAMPAFST